MEKPLLPLMGCMKTSHGKIWPMSHGLSSLGLKKLWGWARVVKKDLSIKITISLDAWSKQDGGVQKSRACGGQWEEAEAYQMDGGFQVSKGQSEHFTGVTEAKWAQRTISKRILNVKLRSWVSCENLQSHRWMASLGIGQRDTLL